MKARKSVFVIAGITLMAAWSLRGVNHQGTVPVRLQAADGTDPMPWPPGPHLSFTQTEAILTSDGTDPMPLSPS
jgi:hypothetical protein